MAVNDVMKTINEVCRSKGGHYAGYSCKVVSWDDVSRGTVGGSLSCWGANITDTYLKSKTGQRLFTVRSDNWNEKLGAMKAEDIAVVAGDGGPSVRPMTLRTVLQQMGQLGGYAGLESGTDLSDPSLDSKCSIRFQTTFLPVEGSADGKSTLEFATEAYNYNTMSDEDPRNLVLLCTSQGMAVQQDGRGAKKLFHHAVDDSGRIHRYWLEAEESRHQVGGEQRETAEERAEAQARGKATSSVIGIRAMGQRFNVLMTIQVPLKQNPPKRQATGIPAWSLGGMFSGVTSLSADQAFKGLESVDQAEEMMDMDCFAAPQSLSWSAKPKCRRVGRERSRERCARPRPTVGQSSAARVSRGSEYDTWSGLFVKAPKRNPAEHVTVTVVMYNAVKGGVPSAADVLAAIDDLESLYRACSETGRLAQSSFDFMKAPLAVNDMLDITAKVKYQPPPVQVVGYDKFPEF